MRIAEKYILKEWLKSFLFSFSVICFFYILADLFSHIDEFIKSKSSLSIILQYYLFSIPLISIYILVPLSTVIATSFCFSVFMHSQEIIVLRTCGWNVLTIIRPILTVLIILSLSFIYFNEVLFENFLQQQQRLKILTQSKASSSKMSTVENITYLSENGEKLFAKRMTRNKYMTNILILDEEKMRKIQAQRAVFIKDNIWRLYSAYIHYLDTGKIEFFETMEIPIARPEELLFSTNSFLEMYPTDTIRKRIKYFKKIGVPELVMIWKIELYKKYAICFFSLILNISLIGMFMKVKKKQNLISNFGTGLLLSFLFYVLFSIFVALGKGGYIPPLLSVLCIPSFFCLWGILKLMSLP